MPLAEGFVPQRKVDGQADRLQVCSVETGSGTVLAVVTGGVTTNNDNGPSNCNFLPTAAIIPVR